MERSCISLVDWRLMGHLDHLFRLVRRLLTDSLRRRMIFVTISLSTTTRVVRTKLVVRRQSCKVHWEGDERVGNLSPRNVVDNVLACIMRIRCSFGKVLLHITRHWIPNSHQRYVESKFSNRYRCPGADLSSHLIQRVVFSRTNDSNKELSDGMIIQGHHRLGK